MTPLPSGHDVIENLSVLVQSESASGALWGQLMMLTNCVSLFLQCSCCSWYWEKWETLNNQLIQVLASFPYSMLNHERLGIRLIHVLLFKRLLSVCVCVLQHHRIS